MSVYDDDALRLELKRRLTEGKTTASAWARDHGLVEENVLVFLRGARPAGPRLLAAMGLRRKTIYTDE